MTTKRITVLVMLATIIATIAPTSAIFSAQAQNQVSDTAEKFVELADKAGQQVKDLIDLVYANDTALQKIEDVGLLDELDGNVTLYNQGMEELAAAYTTLENEDYQGAIDSAIAALSVFREVFRSIHIILESAGLQKGHLIENQGLLEAITRELQRIDRLREILPDETPQEITDLLDHAEETLNEARTLLLDGDETEAKSLFLEAKLSISQVYQYLKAQAEESNTWRLYNYCEGVQQRIQERFRYGRDQGVDFTGVLQSFGYQSENQFMEALQNMTQTALGEQNFNDAMQDCERISQMVQEMEQALNQEINRHQGQYGSSGSGNGYGGNGGSP